MRLFLDTSVLLAASGSATGASREIFRRAVASGWTLLATPYVIEEVLRNLPDLPTAASADWARLRPALVLMDDVLTIDRPAVFPAGKDRPILFSSLAWADVLVTLDQGDFGALMDRPFYGLVVLKPGMFLERERAAGRLRE
jgi:predicted nucleic acid-binding protein